MILYSRKALLDLNIKDLLSYCKDFGNIDRLEIIFEALHDLKLVKKELKIIINKNHINKKYKKQLKNQLKTIENKINKLENNFKITIL